MKPIIRVVGRTTSDASRILAVFDDASVEQARLAYRVDGGSIQRIDTVTIPAVPYARAVFDMVGLSPGGTVQYEVEGLSSSAAPPEPSDILAENSPSFRLLPSARPLRIALVSCNDIDNDSIPKARRGALWRALAADVAEGRVDLVLHAGDQIYADNIPRGWSESEGKVGHYRRHYVNTWTHPDVAAVLARCPSMMMWDDHDIYDGAGSHDEDGSPAAVLRRAAAHTVFQEFQTPLNPSPFASNAWTFEANRAAIIALDGRKERLWSAHRVLGETQLRQLELQLNAISQNDPKHVFIILGLPIMHLPSLIFGEDAASVLSPDDVDDVRDAWGARNNQVECRRLLTVLFNFAGFCPNAQVTILSGDIHVATLAKIKTTLRFGPQRVQPSIYQVVSSGIGRPAAGWLLASLARLEGDGEQELFNEEIAGRLRRIDGADRSVVLSKRNYAILTMSDDSGERWETNGNLMVEFVAEFGDEIRRLPQLLPKWHVET